MGRQGTLHGAVASGKLHGVAGSILIGEYGILGGLALPNAFPDFVDGGLQVTAVKVCDFTFDS